MTDSTATLHTPDLHAPLEPRTPASYKSGEAAMSQLAERIATMAPPMNLSPNAIVRPSPAVAAALATSAAIAKRADERARRSRSVIGLTVDSFVSACSFIPYALVGLVLRLVIARVFFFDGQTRISGPKLPLTVQGFDLSVVLPLQVKAETFTAFLTQYPPMPVPPALAAYLVSYAEFILPIMLVVGFGTRFAALGLLIMTAMIQVYVMPQALWSVHVYWASMLLVLLSLGAGPVSIDRVIRYFAKR
jgi:putative oxidoreductase